MIKNFKSASRKVLLSKKERLLAGNQLTIPEKESLMIASFIVSVPIFVAGMMLMIYI